MSPGENVMTYSRIAAAVSAFLFLFFYGTGQAFCLCDQSDNCTGIANELSHSVKLSAEKCCDDTTTNIITSTDDCCAKCPTTEQTCSGIRTPDTSDDQIQKHNLFYTAWIQVLGSVARTSSAQLERPPPVRSDHVSIPIYIVYRSLLI